MQRNKRLRSCIDMMTKEVYVLRISVKELLQEAYDAGRKHDPKALHDIIKELDDLGGDS